MDIPAILKEFGGVITALGITIPGILAAWLHLRQWNMKSDERVSLLEGKEDRRGRSIVRRGFVEAVGAGLLTQSAGADGRMIWLVAGKAREAYAPLMVDLRQLALSLSNGNKPPSDVALVLAIEERFEEWLLINVCLKIGVYDYGCMAIASALARETDSVRASLTASPSHPGGPSA